MFEGWYAKADADFTYQDEILEEFANVMRKAGMEVVTNTVSERTRVLTKSIYDLIKFQIANLTSLDSSKINKLSITRDIVSYLFFSNAEVEEMMDNIAASDFNLEVDYDCYYVR